MNAVQARQALEAFKSANPQWAKDPRLTPQWAKLQRQYETALFGYSAI
jgi:hypothetical protein